MSTNDLDAVDRRLLRALQEDGRLSNAELARRCNLSAAACFERVRRLRERKVITGYAALIDPACYGGHCEVDLAMLTLFDTPPEPFWEAYGEPDPGWNPGRYVPSTEKIRKELGLQPTVGLDEAICRTALWNGWNG